MRPPRKRNASGQAGVIVESGNSGHDENSTESYDLPFRPFLVVTVKANGNRVIFSKHATRVAAEDLVAGLAKVGCPAHVEVADPRADYAQLGGAAP